jgi:hypothetical protein
MLHSPMAKAFASRTARRFRTAQPRVNQRRVYARTLLQGRWSLRRDPDMASSAPRFVHSNRLFALLLVARDRFRVERFCPAGVEGARDDEIAICQVDVRVPRL